MLSIQNLLEDDGAWQRHLHFWVKVAEQITPESIQNNLKVFFPVEKLLCHFNSH